METKTLNTQTPAKASLENLFEFVNKDIKPLPESDFIGLLHTYTRFVCQHESRYPFLKFRKKHDEYMDGLLTPTPSQALLDRKAFFVELQSHLRSRLEIIDSVKPKESDDAQVFIKMTGTRKVLVDREADSFLDCFWPNGVKSDGELNLDNEKLLADLIFSEIILDGNLKPSRFGRCLRCESFFYQTTGKKRLYCSDRCSSATRQEKHLEKKMGKKKRTQKVGKA